MFWVGNCTIKAFGAGTKGSWAMVLSGPVFLSSILISHILCFML